MSELTLKEQRFVDEYMVDLNATQAYVRATGAENLKTAATEGWKLLRKPEVQAALAERRKELADKTKLDAEWVLRGLKENFERAMQAEPVRDRDGNPTGEYTYQGAVANKALELVGRHNKMFADKIEHTLSGAGSLEEALALLPEAIKVLKQSK
jgi:phage terminase small subunit